GVSTLMGTRGQNLNFAVPVGYLRPLLASGKAVPLAEFTRRAGSRRSIPHHELALLDGCSALQLGGIVAGLAKAIAVGAPLYNDGNHEACFRIYEGAALDLVRKLARCAGIRHALEAGLRRAGTMEGYDDRAWALRDAFDGLIAVIERRFAR